MAVLGTIWYGGAQLVAAREKVRVGQFEEAAILSLRAKESFERGLGWMGGVGGELGEKVLGPVMRVAVVGQRGADLAFEGTRLAPKVGKFLKGFWGQRVDFEVEREVAEIGMDLEVIDQKLGLLDGEMEAGGADWVLKMAEWFGVEGERVEEAILGVGEARQMISQARSVLGVVEKIAASEGQKNYLLVFQNSAEIRPTGGFIGSYGIVRFEKGRVLSYKINDIYDADGQLRGRIVPPDEILHFLGQPNWYMRDANFSPDFPLSAERLEWFLEKETGVRADGVIGINVGAVEKLLRATGPIFLSDFNETVTADNFFERAEYQSEINFFPGSTKKKDYIGAVASTLLEKVTNDKGTDLLALSRALGEAMTEKEVVAYFNEKEVQKVIEENGWSGTIAKKECLERTGNCFMVVEANFGANKANFFLRKAMSVATSVGKEGAVDVTVTMDFKNESPSEAWPGGKYKNYLRFLVPTGTKLLGFDTGSGKKPLVSTTLTEEVLKKVRADQFLVIKTAEASLVEREAKRMALTSFGTLLEVGVGETKRVVFKYQPPYRLDFSSKSPVFVMDVIKQPGNGGYPMDFTLDYPSFLRLADGQKKAEMLVFPQRVVYNVDLAKDRNFVVRFNLE